MSCSKIGCNFEIDLEHQRCHSVDVHDQCKQTLNFIEAYPIRYFLPYVQNPDYYEEIILRIKLPNLRKFYAEVWILNVQDLKVSSWD